MASHSAVLSMIILLGTIGATCACCITSSSTHINKQIALDWLFDPDLSDAMDNVGWNS